MHHILVVDIKLGAKSFILYPNYRCECNDVVLGCSVGAKYLEFKCSGVQTGDNDNSSSL